MSTLKDNSSTDQAIEPAREWRWSDADQHCLSADRQANSTSAYFAGAAAAVMKVCTYTLSNGTDRSSAFRFDGSVETLPDEQRETTLQLMRNLQAIRPDELVLGDRMGVMREFFSKVSAAESRDFCDALGRVVLTDEACLGEDAKTAAIRYFGVYESRLSPSDLSKFFLSVLTAGSEGTAIAAARSLGDIGNIGMIPALAHVLKERVGTKIGAETSKTIKMIERSNGLDTNS